LLKTGNAKKDIPYGNLGDSNGSTFWKVGSIYPDEFFYSGCKKRMELDVAVKSCRESFKKG